MMIMRFGELLQVGAVRIHRKQRSRGVLQLVHLHAHVLPGGEQNTAILQLNRVLYHVDITGFQALDTLGIRAGKLLDGPPLFPCDMGENVDSDAFG